MVYTVKNAIDWHVALNRLHILPVRPKLFHRAKLGISLEVFCLRVLNMLLTVGDSCKHLEPAFMEYTLKTSNVFILLARESRLSHHSQLELSHVRRKDPWQSYRRQKPAQAGTHLLQSILVLCPACQN